MPLTALLHDLEVAAVEAGRAIAKVRHARSGFRLKQDGSPVTDADRIAEELILTRLLKIDGTTPVVAEEQTAIGGCANAGARRFYLVDPLDGTKEYVKGLPDYTVNIALIEDGVPVAGVVFAPERGELFTGGGGAAFKTALAPGASLEGAQRAPIRTRESQEDVVCVVSASHPTPGTEAFIRRLGVAHRVAIGSSLKFCLIASGAADIYPRLGRTMQWDTAAADAVLRSAGGSTHTIGGAALTYGPRGGGRDAFENPPFVAFGAFPPNRLREMLAAVR